MNWVPVIYFLILCIFYALMGTWARSGKGGKHWRDTQSLLKEDKKKNGWREMDNYNHE
jgi:hypothetical protein